VSLLKHNIAAGYEVRGTFIINSTLKYQTSSADALLRHNELVDPPPALSVLNKVKRTYEYVNKILL